MVAAVVSIVVLLQALWIWGVSTVNDREKRQAFHYLKEGRECAGAELANEVQADNLVYESRPWYKK